MKPVASRFYYKNNRLQQLRGFCYTAQYGNVTRAAERLGLMQPNVSRQIKSLENDLGVSLFHRKGPHLSLTTEGKRLYERAMPLIDGIHHLHEEFHEDLKAAKRTELHIAANAAAKDYLMPAIVRRYLDVNADIRIVVHFADQDEAVKLLLAGEVDCALLPRRHDKAFPKECDYTAVLFCKPSVITRRDHPLAGQRDLSVEEISRYKLTLPPEELNIIPKLYESFSRRQIMQKSHLSFMNAEVGREYIENGSAITIAPDLMITEDDGLVATPLTHLFAAVDYGIVKKRSAPVNENVVKFIEITKEYAQQRELAFSQKE